MRRLKENAVGRANTLLSTSGRIPRQPEPGRKVKRVSVGVGGRNSRISMIEQPGGRIRIGLRFLAGKERRQREMLTAAVGFVLRDRRLPSHARMDREPLIQSNVVL